MCIRDRDVIPVVVAMVVPGMVVMAPVTHIAKADTTVKVAIPHAQPLLCIDEFQTVVPMMSGMVSVGVVPTLLSTSAKVFN